MQNKIELTFTPDYVQWGVWECLRELVQNTLDSHDCGHEMKITHDAEHSTLTLYNEGAKLRRADLVLGVTDKRGVSEMRGSFGEGMKLAWAGLCRLGRPVTIVCGVEAWIPKIEHSEMFGVDLLVIEIAPHVPVDGVSVEIQGIGVEEWDGIKRRILSLADEEIDRVSSYWGSILLTPNHRGKLYSKGIYICQLPEAQFGYDLKQVTLDRDRSIAHDWSLKMEIPQVAMDAVMTESKLAPEMLAALMNAASLESRSFCVFYGTTPEFAERMAGEITAQHGDVVVVDSDESSVLVHEVGRKPLLVSEGILRILRPHLPTVESIADDVSRAIECKVDANTLCDETLLEVAWLGTMVRLVMPDLNLVCVKFKRGDQRVWLQGNDLLLDVRRMDAGGGALLLLVHEKLRQHFPRFGTEFLITAIDTLRDDAGKTCKQYGENRQSGIN